VAGTSAAPGEYDVIGQARQPDSRRRILAAMHAVLSDDHNYERGLAALGEVIDKVADEDGTAGLADFAVALSLELAGALERLGNAEGLAARDLAEIWFTD
jgi:hypothetical protein